MEELFSEKPHQVEAWKSGFIRRHYILISISILWITLFLAGVFSYSWWVIKQYLHQDNEKTQVRSSDESSDIVQVRNALLVDTFTAWLYGKLEWVYHDNGSSYYSVSHWEDNHNAKKMVYRAKDNQKIINSNDTVVLYDIQATEIIYWRYDSSKTRYLYSNDTLIATSDAPSNNQFNPFWYKKFWDVSVYITYSKIPKKYSVYYNNKKILSNFTRPPKFYLIANKLYIEGREWSKSILYKKDNKIAETESDTFFIKEVGDKISYQTNKWAKYTLYLWTDKISESVWVNFAIKAIDGKIAYTTYDINTNQTSLYLGDSLIAKIDRNINQNWLNYGILKWKFYYSYIAFTNKTGNTRDKDITVINGKVYKDIWKFDIFWEGWVAYLRYNKTTDSNDLYLENRLIASGVMQEFGILDWNLYYVVYDKKTNLRSFYVYKKFVNSSTKSYYFENAQNSIFYAVLNPETKEIDSYINDKLMVSGAQRTGILYLQKAREWADNSSLSKIGYSQDASGMFILHGLDWAIQLTRWEEIWSIWNNKSMIYVSSIKGTETTITIYQLQ